jgi:hypothetical protein
MEDKKMAGKKVFEIKVWTEDEMAARIGTMPVKALIKPLKRLWDRQTASEQAMNETTDSNGVGFNAYDAPFAGRMIESFEQYKNFTPRMAISIRKMLKKYRKQLVEIANQVEQKHGPREHIKAPEKPKAKPKPKTAKKGDAIKPKRMRTGGAALRKPGKKPEAKKPDANMTPVESARMKYLAKPEGGAA